MENISSRKKNRMDRSFMHLRPYVYSVHTCHLGFSLKIAWFYVCILGFNTKLSTSREFGEIFGARNIHQIISYRMAPVSSDLDDWNSSYGTWKLTTSKSADFLIFWSFLNEFIKGTEKNEKICWFWDFGENIFLTLTWWGRKWVLGSEPNM